MPSKKERELRGEEAEKVFLRFCVKMGIDPNTYWENLFARVPESYPEWDEVASRYGKDQQERYDIGCEFAKIFGFRLILKQRDSVDRPPAPLAAVEQLKRFTPIVKKLEGLRRLSDDDFDLLNATVSARETIRGLATKVAALEDLIDNHRKLLEQEGLLVDDEYKIKVSRKGRGTPPRYLNTKVIPELYPYLVGLREKAGQTPLGESQRDSDRDSENPASSCSCRPGIDSGDDRQLHKEKKAKRRKGHTSESAGL